MQLSCSFAEHSSELTGLLLLLGYVSSATHKTPHGTSRPAQRQAQTPHLQAPDGHKGHRPGDRASPFVPGSPSADHCPGLTPPPARWGVLKARSAWTGATGLPSLPVLYLSLSPASTANGDKPPIGGGARTVAPVRGLRPGLRSASPLIGCLGTAEP